MAQLVLIDTGTLRTKDGKAINAIGDLVSIHEDDVDLTGPGYAGFKVVKVPGTAEEVMQRARIIAMEALKSSAFITQDLKASLVVGHDDLWELQADLIYYSLIAGLIVVPSGFRCDFASVPRLPIVYALWGNRAHREGVIHDYLFRYDSKPVVPFSTANKVFLESMAALGKPSYIRYPMYLAVQLFSHGCYHRLSVHAFH